MSDPKDVVKKDEVAPLNADEVEIGQLDEADLEDVSGGCAAHCGSFSMN